MKFKFILTLFLLPLSGVILAQKSSLTQEAYDGWKAINSPTLSEDGAWAFYTIDPQRGDGVLEFYRIEDGQTTRFDRGTKGAFFNRNRWATYLLTPTFEQVRQAKIEKKKPDQMPKDTAVIVRLEDMDTLHLPQAQGLITSPKGPLVLYTREVVQQPDSTDTDPKEVKFKRLVILDVMRSDSILVDSVKSFSVSEQGNLVLYSRESDSLKAVYALTYDTRHGARHTELWRSVRGQISANFALDRAGLQGAYLVTADTLEHAIYELYYFNTAELKSRQITSEQVVGMHEGYAISRFGTMTFTPEGERLQFNIAPKPIEIPKDTLPEDEKISLDIWSGQDTVIQSVQLVNLQKTREAAYPALYFPQEKRALALGNEDLSIRLPERDHAPYALAVTSKPYDLYTENRIRPFLPYDTYLIDLKSGQRTKILEATYNGGTLSPSGRWVTYYNMADSCWYSIDVKTLHHKVLTRDIPYPLWNEDDDHPAAKPLYGFYGWTNRDQMLIPDRYDLWLVDPSGKRGSENITKIGRESQTQFRLLDLPRTPAVTEVDLARPMLFVSFNRANKENGYYRLEYGSSMERLVEGPYLYKLLSYARQGDRILYSRENFNEFPDLWVSNERFEEARQVTQANPQQSSFRWGSVDLIHWTDTHGGRCEGLVYYPEDYDPTKPYPTIVYFYEKQTFLRYAYHVPRPSRSTINPAYCASNGYIVFIPDINYRIGFPGQSAYDAVVSGTLALVDRGIADPQRIGLQGQSWGGYQTAYLVTQTDLFACSAPGAAVSNMISAYGGIRWQTGLSRTYAYETSQSRIGATPWQRRDLYIDNSPIFFADRVNTPQLLRHSDQDGAVPWYQSIEYYIALRRLGKPVWFLNYSGDAHNLMSRAACMDWDRRMYQFFDHYLKGAPMPRWMSEGIKATEKNIDFKLELGATNP